MFRRWFERPDALEGNTKTELTEVLSAANSPQKISTTIRNEMFSWVGVLGTAGTLLSSLDPLLQLAAWAHYIVDHWNKLIVSFWRSVLFFVSIHITEQIASLLNG